MKTSELINEIATSMAKAQAEMKPASKDATNPHYKSKYSDIASVWDAIRKPLTANGISVWQDVSTCEAGVSVITRLVHCSGQWTEFGPLIMPLSKKDAHGVGSAISYCKRYALCAAVGVVSSEDDDDANDAVGDKNQYQQSTYVKKKADELISSEQMVLVEDLLRQCDEKFTGTAFKRICSEGAKSWETMPARLFPVFKAAAEKHIKSRETADVS